MTPQVLIKSWGLLLLGFISMNLVNGQEVIPADPKASKKTKALYSNLARLAQKGILFGHQDDLAYGVGWKDRPGKSDVKDVVGSYPAVSRRSRTFSSLPL